MFGHQDDVNQGNQSPMSDGSTSGPAWTQDPTIPAQTSDAPAPSAPPVPPAQSVTPQSAVSITPTVSNQHTGEYLLEPPDEKPDTPSADDSSVTPTDATKDANDDKLLDIKQQALQQLTPLVGHLDQSPEEKFRTTMMMIQASDNKALLQEAYESAQAITDEKSRAQALLDVVNEINYFTQRHE